MNSSVSGSVGLLEGPLHNVRLSSDSQLPAAHDVYVLTAELSCQATVAAFFSPTDDAVHPSEWCARQTALAIGNVQIFGAMEPRDFSGSPFWKSPHPAP